MCTLDRLGLSPSEVPVEEGRLALRLAEESSKMLEGKKGQYHTGNVRVGRREGECWKCTGCRTP